MDPRHDAVLDQVLELTVLLNEDMSASFERDGLTPARAHLLWVLQQSGPSTQRDLADALGVSPRNVTGLVDSLEASRLVTRRPHPTDRRATLVTFTAEGERIAAQMTRDKAMLGAGLFGPLAAAELEGFSRTLGEILDRLKVMIAEAAADPTAGT
ncbi:MAG TPA: MarR family transcriptional regulator [Nocardioidaceae bacterium]|nr:MarR family transcriptional regulator [Nocardioidaceae bacterium]